MKFTDQNIKALKPREKRYEVSEDNGKGLLVRVSPTGNKSWVYIYKYKNRMRRLTLGKYPEMTISKAHNAHSMARSLLKDKGIDPGKQKQQILNYEKNAESVSSLAEIYIERYAKRTKKTWKEDERILNKEIKPRWGELKAKDIRRRDVLSLLDEIVDRGAPIAANRTLEIIRRMFNYAIERDILDTSPCVMVKAPGKEIKRERVLNQEEIISFWEGTEKIEASDTVKFALKLQLVTAQRRGEIALAKWNHFDLNDGWWTIPGELSKNGLSHRVPLSCLAINLLNDIKEVSSDSEFLFPSPLKKHPIKPGALTRAISRNRHFFKIEHFTPHDLRRTAASQMTSIGIQRLVVSKILNHVDSGVTAIYDRHSYDQEKRHAMDIWDGKLREILKIKIINCSK